MLELYTGQLLCSRLCHDLITPVGAVLSGLELLEEHKDGGDVQEIIDLLRLSASECSRRLSLLRFCFGAGAASTISNLNEIDTTLQHSTDTRKHNFSIDLPKPYMEGNSNIRMWAQLLANLYSVSLDALPYGGQVAISNDSGSCIIQMNLSGRIVTIPNEVKVVIVNGENIENLSARTIQAYLIWQLSQHLSCKITIEEISEKTQIYVQIL